ncbi:MAG: replication factor C small subunit [Thermoplasmata archaeon]
MEEVWVEKYRPRNLGEVVNQKDIVDRLKAYVKTGSLPHLLFAGPAGTGKTTSAIALARELFGEDWRINFAQTNASVAPETPCLVRIHGQVERTTFGAIARENFDGGDEKYSELSDFDILSVDQRYRVRFLPATLLSRHPCNELITVRYDGGYVRTSPDHSVMVFNRVGGIRSRRADALRPGDLLIGFAEELAGFAQRPSLLEFSRLRDLRPYLKPRSKKRNMRFYEMLDLNRRLSWLMGLYLAEGCSIMHKGDTAGGLVFTVGYPEEFSVAERAALIIDSELGLRPTLFVAPSGFDRSRYTSMQVRTLNTQLGRFFRHHFYNRGERKSARAKRVPTFIFAAEPEIRKSFLKGYLGDASGEWGRYVRYSSRSQDALVDVAWLGRLSGLHSSTFQTESRLLWPAKHPLAHYLPDLVPSELVHELFRRLGLQETYFLRHSLYAKKSKRMSRSAVLRKLTQLKPTRSDIYASRILRILNSSLYPVQVTDVGRQRYDGDVYDVTVPGSQTFWGGTTPVLLHNSDARGIDVVRTTIKNQARMAPIGEGGFKIIFLDEADHLTNDAQAALRRTMELYTRTARFILSVNYSSRIIPPIQSRTAVFRFRPLKPEHVQEYMTRIAKEEDLKVTEEGMDALVYVAQGDLRKATNALQVAAAVSTTIDADSLYRAASAARPEEVKKLVETALTGDFLGARGMLDDLLLEYGLAAEDLLREIYRAVYDLNVPDRVKVEMVDRVGEADYRLIQGSNDRIQLEALLSRFALLGRELG